MLDRTPFDLAPKSRWCALARGPETVDLWPVAPTDDPATPRPPAQTLETARSRIEGLAFLGPNRLLTVHQMGELAEWAVGPNSGSADGPLREANPPLEPCAFAVHRGDSSTYIAVGDRRGRLLLLTYSDSRSPAARLTRAHRTNVVSLTFDPDGTRLASTGRDRMIRIWAVEAPTDDTPSLEALDFDAPSSTLTGRHALPGSQGWPLAPAFAHAGSRLATGCMDNGLYLWDPTADDPLVAASHLHHNWVVDVAWSPDDSRIATGSWDGTAAVFDPEGLDPEFQFNLHDDFVPAVLFVPRSAWLVTAGYDGRLGVWNWQKGELETQIRAHANWIEALELTDDGHLLSISSDDQIKLWSLSDGRCLATLGGENRAFELGRGVDFSAYVDADDLPELETDAGPAAGAALSDNIIRRLDNESRLGEDEDAQTAVGLLEAAIDSSESAPSETADSAPGDTVRLPAPDSDAEQPTDEAAAADLDEEVQKPDLDVTEVDTEDMSELDEEVQAPDLDVTVDETDDPTADTATDTAADDPATDVDASIDEDLDLAAGAEPGSEASLEDDLELAASPDGPGSTAQKSLEEDLDLAGGTDDSTGDTGQPLEEALDLAGGDAEPAAGVEDSLQDDLNLAGTDTPDRPPADETKSADAAQPSPHDTDDTPDEPAPESEKSDSNSTLPSPDEIAPPSNDEDGN